MQTLGYLVNDFLNFAEVTRKRTYSMIQARTIILEMYFLFAEFIKYHCIYTSINKRSFRNHKLSLTNQ